MEDDKSLKSMHRFQALIYELLGDSLKGREDMIDELILIYSAVLMKTAIELYTMSFSDDKIVKEILTSAINSVPEVRQKFETSIISTKGPTIH